MDVQCVLGEVRTDVLCVNYTKASVQRDDIIVCRPYLKFKNYFQVIASVRPM
jgi:hypothetical protein